jgi:uncharacterized protein
MVAVNVAQLLKAPTGSVRDFDFDEPPPPAFAPDLVLGGPLRGHVRLMRTSAGILVSCDYHAEARAECARCLGEARVRLYGRVEDEAQPSVDLRTGEWIPDAVGEERLRVDERNVLDLDDLIRQDALLGVPLQPLCDAACRGLCPSCGQNRNLVACACPPDEVGTLTGPLGEALARELQRKTREG